MELWIGPSDRGVSAFESVFTRRAAWFANKEELMEANGPGQRPWAWWQFEAPQPLSEKEDPVKALRRWGLLTPAEEAGLKAIEDLRKGGKA